MIMNEEKKSSGELYTSIDMGSGGIKEKYNFPKELLQNNAEIKKGSEVVLITPDMGKKSDKDEYFIPNLHNGLFRIHAFLQEKGIHSVMVNCDIDNMEKVFDSVGKYHPGVIAFSPYYDSMKKDLENIARTAETSPNSLIVVGGFEASLNSQWEKFGGLVDVIGRGEGEFLLYELVKRYKDFSRGESVSKTDFLNNLRESMKDKDIPGVSILDPNQRTELRRIKERITPELYQEINVNAFEKHLELSPIEKYWKLSRAMFDGKKDTYFRFVSSDHCPYKCIFCQSSIYYSTIIGTKASPVRYVSPENILKIIKAISNKYPFINHIYVDDENFIINRPRAVETLKLIIENKESGKIQNDFAFQCRTRTDNIDPEMCKLLKQAGFETISLGSESYSSKELEYMRKKTSPEKNLEAVKIISDSGLKVAENYILYTPNTTKDTFYDSAKGICRNIRDWNVDGAATLFLTPLPGTELWGGGEDYETKKNFDYQESLFKNKVMFHNKKLGYDYIGEEIIVPRLGITIPHPEIVLVNDPLMRKVSIESLLHLPKVVDGLRKIAGGAELSRSFVTLANLASAGKILYDKTNESRWKELDNEISEIVMSANR
jgi:radical SAM superfamily enzyme YgiQ (UPF0313 family)